MNRYKKFIKKGVSEQISKIPFHNYAPMKRLSMLSKKRLPSSNTHIAIHFVNGNHKKMLEYSMLHKHNADEINLIVSENSKLKCGAFAYSSYCLRHPHFSSNFRLRRLLQLRPTLL